MFSQNKTMTSSITKVH